MAISLEHLFSDPELRNPRNPKIQIEDGSAPLLLKACGEIHIQQHLNHQWIATAHSYEGKILIGPHDEPIVGTGATLQEAVEDLILEVEFL